MLICDRCGSIIEDSELRTSFQCHGYTDLGDAFEERIAERCRCGGDFVDATRCEICGEWFNDTKCYGVCEMCIDEHMTVHDALGFGKDNTTSIDDINGAVASLLTTEEINRILTRWVEENFVDYSRDISKFIKSELNEFSEWLKEKAKESD